jgi:hypothetical protein
MQGKIQGEEKVQKGQLSWVIRKTMEGVTEEATTGQGLEGPVSAPDRQCYDKKWTQSTGVLELTCPS